MSKEEYREYKEKKGRTKEGDLKLDLTEIKEFPQMLNALSAMGIIINIIALNSKRQRKLSTCSQKKN